VDHSGAVDRGQRGGDADGQVLQAGAAHRPAVPDEFIEVRAVDELRDDEERLALELRVEHRSGAEAPDPAGRLDLAAEAVAERLVVGQVRIDHLDRGMLAGLGLGKIDGAHPAAAQAADDLIAAETLRIALPQRTDHVITGHRGPDPPVSRAIRLVGGPGRFRL
jgi:hypothetical protein